MKEEKPQHWPAFHCEWFKRNQRWLVGMANLPIAGRWLRRRLGLRRDLPVTILRPMAAHYALPDGQFLAEVYTNWKFSRAVYHAFKPLWWAIHYWDELIADRWLPELSYGFDTLTISATGGYPTTNFDMAIGADATNSGQESPLQTYSRARSGENFQQFINTSLQVGQTYTPNPNAYSINRFVVKLDLGGALGGLPIRVSSATLDLASFTRLNTSTFSIQAQESGLPEGAVDVTLANWNPSNNTVLFSKQLSTYADAAYTNQAFLQAGVNFINTRLTGYLKLCFRHSQDISNTVPSQTTQMGFYSAEYEGGLFTPRVTLTYSRLINHSSFDSTIALGSPTVTQANPQTVMYSIDSSIKLGSPTITQTNLPIQLDGLDSSITLGTPTIATVQLEGVDASIALGTPTIATIQLPAIDSLIELGAPYVVRTGDVVVSMNSVDSSITLGAPTVGQQVWTVTMLGIDSSITLGAPTLDSPYPDGELYEGPYIARIVDQPAEYGYAKYEFEDGSIDVNVQPVGNRRWQLEYTGLSAAEVAVLAGHYNGMRGRVTTFRFYHRRDAVIYSCRYVSMTLPQRERAWSNDVQVVLEALL